MYISFFPWKKDATTATTFDLGILSQRHFFYQSLFDGIISKEYPLLDEFMEVLKRFEGLKFSSDKETKLTRAQGAIWAFFADNPRLREL